MGTVSMPTAVAVAGGALCLLGGYVIGVVAGPDTTARATAEVVSFEPSTDRLCLGGEAVAGVPAAEEGILCGTWRRTAGAGLPEQGDTFRFVTMTSERDRGDAASAGTAEGDTAPRGTDRDPAGEGAADSAGRPESERATFIYGDVVP